MNRHAPITGLLLLAMTAYLGGAAQFVHERIDHHAATTPIVDHGHGHGHHPDAPSQPAEHDGHEDCSTCFVLMHAAAAVDVADALFVVSPLQFAAALRAETAAPQSTHRIPDGRGPPIC